MLSDYDRRARELVAELFAPPTAASTMSKAITINNPAVIEGMLRRMSPEARAIAKVTGKFGIGLE